MKKIAIGIPARNEAQNIANCLASLKKALQKGGSLEFTYDVFVIINNCTDNTEDIVGEFDWVHVYQVSNCTSKIDAQRAWLFYIDTLNTEYKAYMSVDADIIFSDEFMIDQFLYALLENTEVKLVYASRSACIENNILHALQAAHYKHQAIYKKRNYFHGRCYAFVPEIKSAFFQKGLVNSVSRYDLVSGPKIDDVYLSRYLADAFGLVSMCESKYEIIFCPPKTVNDFYHALFRLKLEFKRLDMLFPDIAYTQKEFFIRKVIRSHYFDLSLKEKFLFGLYKVFEFTCTKYVDFRITTSNLKNVEQWKQICSSKKVKI